MLTQFLVNAPFTVNPLYQNLSISNASPSPGTTALRQSLNLTVQYYADPVV